MKRQSSFLLGAVLSVLGSATAFRASTTFAAWVAPHARETPPLVVATRHSVGLAVMRGEMVLVRSKNATGVIELTDFASYAAEYRWRVREVPSGLEQRGVGALYERFNGQLGAPGPVTLDREHTSSHIAAGPISMEWSYRSVNSGWLYFDEGLDVHVIDARSFATQSLFDLASR